jgi:hypothetical protein
MPRIQILSDVQAGRPSPLHLNINGVVTELPMNTEIVVTDEQFLALGHSDHAIEILVEGDTVADEAEQAPAPAGSGDGGDAGGGGASGDAPTDISEGPQQADPALTLSEVVEPELPAGGMVTPVEEAQDSATAEASAVAEIAEQPEAADVPVAEAESAEEQALDRIEDAVEELRSEIKND